MPANRFLHLSALALLAVSPAAWAEEAPPPPFRPGSPLSDLPPGFGQMTTAEQLKLLQSRLAVLGVLQQVTEAQKSIANAGKDAGPAAPQHSLPALPPAQPSPVVVQNPVPNPAPALPTVQRIYIRNGVRMADLLSPGHSGPRTVRAGTALGDGLKVSEITADDVVVTTASERVSLPGGGGPSPQPLSPAAPAAEPAADHPGRPAPVKPMETQANGR